MNLLVCLFLVCGIIAVAMGIVALVISGKNAEFAVVQDVGGTILSRSCTIAKARAMVARGEATLIKASYPVTIRLIKLPEEDGGEAEKRAS